MSTCQTEKYGPLTGITFLETYTDGSPKGCAFDEPNTINTPVGILVPNYGAANLRNREGLALEFFKSGQIKSIDLENATEVITSLGTLSAERISFYENGRIHRLFPLNGRINGYWTEHDEYTLAKPMAFDLAVGAFSAKVVSLCFYESGALKSLTMWPQETIEINSPDGLVKVRYGFSLYENGQLKSFEPALPEPIVTPIGIVIAYDSNAHGINCDENSVNYSPAGVIRSLITGNNGLMITAPEGKQFVQPLMKPGTLDPEILVPEPMTIVFSDDKMEIIQDDIVTVDLKTATVRAILVHDPMKKSCGDCSSCSSCG